MSIDSYWYFVYCFSDCCFFGN